MIGARDALKNLKRISDETELSIESICLNFVVSNELIDKVIIGIDSINQLDKNISCLTEVDKVINIKNQLSSVVIEDENILLPYLWKK